MNLPVLSYTFLSCWNICHHQAMRRYILKDLPREPETPQMAWGNAVHEAMESRINDGTPLPESMPWEHLAAPLAAHKVIAEQKAGVTRNGAPCDFFATDVFLRGKLDAPIFGGAECALLVDWKTGKPREDPLELEIGALLLQAQHPHVRKITGRYAWLKENRIGKEHDCSDTLRTWAYVNTVARHVQHAIDTQDFPKMPGPLCGWCPVKDCENHP
jgi:hypothetical protein